ncbi:STAS domain-containing protein [uncultured Jatrophihabitans sp.]|uniref:STAS domain-containing protein n=1 Tax=uncultured Jatrophihabitans sp. TaxID=1610747 RepID=UPI0035CA2A2B
MTVALIGELDVSNTAVVDRVLREQAALGRLFVRVNLSGVTFCDSAGLLVLVEAHNRQLACHGTLVLTGVAPIIARLLAISHLDEALFVADGPGEPPHVRKPCRPAARAR